MKVFKVFIYKGDRYRQPHAGMDMLPIATAGKIPLQISGNSQQDPDWIARNGEGWITYPRAIATLEKSLTSGMRELRLHAVPPNLQYNRRMWI